MGNGLVQLIRMASFELSIVCDVKNVGNGMTCLTVSNYIGLHIKEDKLCDCLSLPGQANVDFSLADNKKKK